MKQIKNVYTIWERRRDLDNREDDRIVDTDVVWLSKEKAQAVCDLNNARFVQSIENYYKRELVKRKAQQTEHDALVSAGLRTPYVYSDPYKPVPENCEGWCYVGEIAVIS